MKFREIQFNGTIVQRMMQYMTEDNYDNLTYDVSI